MTFEKTKRKQRVAIIGSGMAGLVAAHLLQRDIRQRYSVTVFESGKSFSLDSASVSIQDESKHVVDRIDVPMRAFASGYYKNLMRMYKYLKVVYHPQRFVYSFERTAVSKTWNERKDECYFVHASHNHRFPPVPPEGVNLLSWCIELAHVMLCLYWWSFCCAWISPIPETSSRTSESLDEYMKRIMLPRHFINFYLLPLLSSVATCSHTDLLQFPAKDLIDYKRFTTGGEHYTAASLHTVQNTLGSGLEGRYSTLVTKVEVLENGRIEVVWNNASDDGIYQEVFDHVVLAVAPEVVGKIFQPLQKAMAQIPTTLVQSLVQGDGMKRSMKNTTIDGPVSKGARPVQKIHFRTSPSLAQTESIHVYESGAVVTTCPLGDVSSAQNVLSSTKFLRAIRTPRSRRLVNNIFGERFASAAFIEEKLTPWRNGDDGVWLVGGWCWDGMVLLEGCVQSAMRVASALDVDIPWGALET